MDVLRGEVDPALLEGRYLFIGSSAVGLNDLHHTIVDDGFPGVEIHAAFVESALAGDFYREPNWQPLYSLISAVAAGIGLLILFAATGPGIAALGTLAVLCLFAGVSTALFHYQNVFLSVSGPVLTSLFLFTLLSVLLYAIERRSAFFRLVELNRVQQLTLESMAAVAETRDPETGGHIKRTQNYVKALAEYIAGTGKEKTLTPERIDLLYHSAPLHDVGKVGILDHILLKPDRLTIDEFETMKRHVILGKQIMESIIDNPVDVAFLEVALEISATHHEKWDGTGYPAGLAGDDIPISGRLMALADVYDALVSKRHYKVPFSHEKSKNIILEGRGTHFDPMIVDAFLAVEDQFLRIADAYKDVVPA